MSLRIAEERPDDSLQLAVQELSKQQKCLLRVALWHHVRAPLDRRKRQATAVASIAFEAGGKPSNLAV